MPGGLLALVCYGNENVVVSGNPQLSWFYSSFQRYTHFSQEPIQIPLEGPNRLVMGEPIMMRAKIPRQGDLLSDLVLRVQLPDIFSKAYVNVVGGNYELERKYEFAWVRQIGVRMIDTVTFTIGGTKVQEFTSDWISARALLDMDGDTYQKWRYMVGDVPELFDPAQGMYADPSGGYPHVVQWFPTPSNPNPVQNNAPSIPGRILRIPLGLWFSDAIANSLPLVALEYHEAEIMIKFRPIRDLYTILDASGVRLRHGYTSLPYLPSDQYTSVWNPTLYGPLPLSLNNHYGSFVDISGTLRHFLTDFGTGVPTNDGWNLSATLEATYTFLQPEERKMFVTTPLRYNVRELRTFTFPGITSRTVQRLDVHNIATRVVYFARRSDSILYRNQHTNLTNWINPQGARRPHPVPLSGYPNAALEGGIVRPLGRSGLNLMGTQRRIIRAAFFVANGQQLFDSQDSAYFTEYVPYKYLRGNATPYNDFGLATQSEMWPLYAYSFSLDGSDAMQPKGTLNTSRIDRFEIDVDVEPIPAFANYTYELVVCVETLNFLELRGGMGSLKFAK